MIACGGIGLAPLRPAIYHILNHRDDYGRVILLYGARTPKRFALHGRIRRMARQRTSKSTSRSTSATTNWKGHIGVVPVLFYRLRLQPQQTAVMTCGPEIMMRFVVFEALARAVSARKTSSSRWSGT